MTYNRTQGVIIAKPHVLVSTLGPDLKEAFEFAQAAKSAATRRAYRSDFEIFRSWCEGRRLNPPPGRR